MSRKPKLELTWIGKDERPRLEPRILIEDPSKSHHASAKREGDIFSNMLIHGDNLLALKALEADYAGKVKCVFIDPPYNTGSAFEHYDDGIEHSLWLSLMRDRLEIIRKLLAEDGSLWITIDDNEAHYLKVLCDEVFGRKNFVGALSWQKRTSPANDAIFFSKDHDNILVYARNVEIWRPNRIEFGASQEGNYRNPDNDPRGPWNSAAYTCAKNSEERPNLYYAIFNPNTNEEIWPKKTRVWAYGPEKHAENVKNRLIYWGADGKSSSPRIKKFLSNAKSVVPRSIWLNSEVGHNQEARGESLELFGASPFSSPKPERLLQRIIHIASKPGDLVLDSFAGSGTTGAVAHKMGRRWIMVELGEHAHTHIVPRLKKVIDGEDKGGVTEATGWQGGGGYRYFNLAPSLLEADKWGRWVISKDYNAPMLAEALCKHMGFTYAPSQDVAEYWRHGHSSETDFIYVTTLALTQDQLRAISEDVGPDRTLLVCCKAFNARVEDFENLTVTKIPHAILSRCEWGKDDYSLKIANLPEREPEEATPEPAKSRKAKTATPSLFDDQEG
ncbi:MAG: site-specific DNA-methyltransferase [Beijerinckiaceae bacterium]|jgi:adenine-specific DNA-methyltransferase|nr:site-specific DNA-methyltransferase [Beijerinckiaceae bacterium]